MYSSQRMSSRQRFSPNAQGENGQCRRQPSHGAFGQESESQGDVHQQIAAQALRPRLRIEPVVRAKQCRRYGGEQRGVGSQPNGHLVRKQECADSCGGCQSGKSAGAARGQQSHADGRDQRVQQIRQPRGPGSRTQQLDRNCGHPVSQRRLFTKGIAGEQWNRLVGLPTHAPRNVAASLGSSGVQ